jgi:hypothetical protein
MIEKVNQQRREAGFLTVEEMLESDNLFYDLFSVLISRNVFLGKGNTDDCMAKTKCRLSELHFL